MPHTQMKQLTEMKLTGMAAALISQMEQPGANEEPTFRERLALLFKRESLERELRKQKRLLQKARLRLEASVQDIDYQPARIRNNYKHRHGSTDQMSSAAYES